MNSPAQPSARFANLLAFVNVVKDARNWHRRERNGKVARLPEPTRNLINHMIEDGLPYQTIIAKLKQADLLPYPLSDMNLSNWRHGGYQDWLTSNLMAAAGVPPADWSSPLLLPQAELN